MYIELDDLRQSYVVAVNEIRKFIRGKKILVYGLMTLLIFVLWTILPFAAGENFSDFYGDSNGIMALYLIFISTLIVIGVTLFASNVIVSEFEERTALVLFTRPIKKTSIFLGKMVGCVVVEMLFILLYYLGLAAVMLIIEGKVPVELFKYLGMAFMYVLAASGVAMLISSLLKKSGIAAVLTFFTLTLIISMVSLAISLTDVDPWFMLDQASNALSPSSANIPLVGMIEVGRAAMVMLAWSIVTMVLAWIAFIKREF